MKLFNVQINKACNSNEASVLKSHLPGRTMTMCNFYLMQNNKQIERILYAGVAVGKHILPSFFIYLFIFFV